MYRLIIIPVLLFLTGCATSQASVEIISEPETKTVCSCRSDRYNCADFKTRREARDKYEFCMDKVGYDVYRLDRDKDGVACEW